MGLFRALHSIVSPRVLGEETVEAQFKTYRILASRSPDAEPHELLARTLLGRWAAKGKNVNEQSVQTAALSETMQFACLAPPSCVKALGLYILYKENPKIIEQHAQFAVDFELLMRPVQEAQSQGSLEALYRRVNPRMAVSAAEEDSTGGSELPPHAPSAHAPPHANLVPVLPLLATTIAQFIKVNGVRSLFSSDLSAYFTSDGDVFLSSLPPTKAPFKEKIVARVLLGESPGSASLVELINSGGSDSQMVKLAAHDLARWVVAKASESQ